MDWEQCIICKTNKTGETLQCPALSKRKDIGASYSSFASNLQEFQKIDSVPFNVNMEELNSGEGIEYNLSENKAKWHKTCRNAFSNEKLERARKRKLQGDTQSNNEHPSQADTPYSPIKARRSSVPNIKSNNQCFFCDLDDKTEKLHLASSLIVDKKVKQCATIINDSALISKLALIGDLVASDAKYHLNCLVKLYNQARSMTSSSQISFNPIDADELAFAELVAFIDESLQMEELALLKLSDLVKFYCTKLKEHESESSKVNSTRLKSRILEAFPDLTAHNQGRDVLFVLSHEIGSALLDATKNRDSEALILARAAMIIRREILQVSNTFNGEFAEYCQKDSVPRSLPTLLDMIMKGPTTERDPTENLACLTIAQLVVFNSISRVREKSSSDSNYTHHVRNRECPVPIYAALKIHGATRDKSLIDTFYRLGMCISYDRMLAISTETTNSVIARYEKDGVVCPSKLRFGVFTTAAVDNLDHNPSATTSQDSFHGTAISLVQHPTADKPGTERPADMFDPNVVSKARKVASLPSYYTDIAPLTLPSTDLKVPDTESELKPSRQKMTTNGEDWLDHTKEVLTGNEISKEDIQKM